MKKTNTDDYRKLMNNVTLPDNVREAVLEEARQQRVAGAAPVPYLSPAAKRRPLFRALAAGTCALALAAVLIALSGNLPNMPSYLDGSDSGNSFMLAAHASGESDGDHSVALKKDFGWGLGFGWGNDDMEPDMRNSMLGEDTPRPAPEDDTVYVQTNFFLDLSCVGKNIDTLTYTIEGDHAYFYQENWNWGPPPFTIGKPPDPQIQKSFTIPYDDQARDKAAIQRQLHLYFTLDEQAREAYNVNGKSPWENTGPGKEPDIPEDWFGRVRFETFRMFAEKITEHPITLTATFKDGTTQTKSYLIEPVSDFDQRVEEYRASEKYKKEGFHDLSNFFILRETTQE